MTVLSYPLGRPRTAALRGGDCRARDLAQGRNIHGPHRFATTTACRISNGLLRLTVGAAGAAPSLVVEVWRPSTLEEVTIHTGDYFVDVFDDVFPGVTTTGTTGSAGAWLPAGSIVVDSPALTVLLTQVRIVRLSPEAVTIRLVAPVMADAFVTLRRGQRMVHGQHGSTRAPKVITPRRFRWIDSPSPVGVAYSGRVQEDVAAIPDFFRWVGALDTATTNAGSFAVTTPAVSTARFGAGIATMGVFDEALNHHRQLSHVTTARIAVSAA